MSAPSAPLPLPSQNVLIPTSGRYEAAEGTFATRHIPSAVIWRDDPSLPADAFVLEVRPRQLVVRSYSPGGRQYALGMLHKLARRDAHGRYRISCGTYTEIPRTPWRGLMLDSGRQYQSVATIKRKLDLLADLRMNVFHWHLTEGLGWRLDIRRYPRLAEQGSRVAHGLEQQGYYTRDDVRQVVAYAAERGITVVPEIDMPGHAEAALSCYPEMSCFGQPAPIPETGFTDNIFCAGKDATLQFLRDILDEVCELFPSPYIHLGGDEAPKGNWDRCPDCQRRIADHGLADSHELQLWFAAQMAEHLRTKGRYAIFWEDVVASGDYPLPPNVVIHWWNCRVNQDRNLRRALERGYRVLCSPNYYTYLNFPTAPWRGYGAARTFTLPDAYQRNPLDAALASGHPLVIGAECALWTDYVLTEDLLDARLFPRIYALAQLMWAGPVLPYDEFCRTIGE